MGGARRVVIAFILVPLGTETAGYSVVIDGRTYRPLLIDSSGHPQVDVLSSALPAGAATDTVLQAVRDRIGALTSPATGSVNKQLAAAVTALQLIDDLRNALGSVGADTLRTEHRASGTPAWVKQTALGDLLAGALGWDGDAWRRQPLIFGFSAVYAEQVHVANATAGTNILDTAAVPANTLRVITSVSFFDANNAPTFVIFQADHDGTLRDFKRRQTAVANETLDWQGRLYMDASDWIRVTAGGVTLNDDLYLNVSGYDMELAE